MNQGGIFRGTTLRPTSLGGKIVGVREVARQPGLGSVGPAFGLGVLLVLGIGLSIAWNMAIPDVKESKR
jgi:hypothetical protein